MNIFLKLEARFSGYALDDPITFEDIERFERRWKREIPKVYRDLLLEVNGIDFDNEVRFRSIPVLSILSLGGIDSVLRAYGDFAFPFLVPFAASLTHGNFCLNAMESSSPVYIFSPVTEPSPDRLCLEKVSANIAQFVDELTATRVS